MPFSLCWTAVMNSISSGPLWAMVTVGSHQRPRTCDSQILKVIAAPCQTLTGDRQSLIVFYCHDWHQQALEAAIIRAFVRLNIKQIQTCAVQELQSHSERVNIDISLWLQFSLVFSYQCVIWNFQHRYTVKWLKKKVFLVLKAVLH